VCGSNLPLWEGRPWFEYPAAAGAPGHEGWGIVDRLGAGVTGLAVGDRVAALSDRAFAEYDVAPSNAVVPLPAALAEQPFPGEPLGCAMNVFRRSEITSEHTVVIVGIGFLGAVVLSLAVHAGARVIAISRRPFARAVARELGAHITLSLDDPEATRAEVLRSTAGSGADRVVECVGLQSSLDLATDLTATRARLVIAGYHQDGKRQVDMQLWNWRGLDVINAHERDADVYTNGIRDAITAVVDGVLDPRRLYTHTFPLENIESALEALRCRRDGFLKALVTTCD